MTIIRIKNMITLENPPQALVRFSKAALTFENPLYKEAQFFGRYTRGINKYIKVFEEHEGCFLAPRGFLAALLQECSRSDIDVDVYDETVKQESKIDFGSVIKLFDYQKVFVDNILKAKFGGIAVAPPGSGKTITALEIIARLGMRTLWLTHTSDLARQSAERAAEFLPKASVARIGAGKWKEGDLTIALVQTLIRRDITELAEKYPLVIIDECHHVPASSFTEIITKLPASLVIGLSATPYRKDGLEEIMFGVVGPVVAQVKKADLVAAGQIIPATVIQRNTGIAVDERIVDYAKVMDCIYKSKRRLDMIVGDILAEATDGNICIVLTRTIAYGKEIHGRLGSLGFDSSFVYSTEIVSLPRQKKRTITMPKAEREKNIQDFITNKTNIIIATIRFLAEGFDYKPLNRLFMVNPISHRNRALIEQACGRVERPSPGKAEALVFDYVDEHSLLKAQAQNRIEIYEEGMMLVKHNFMGADYKL